MTNHETVACRTTQHCAFHGWCRRCDPAFAAVMSRVNVAIQRTDADDTHWGPLYAAVAEALRPAAVSVPPPAPRADDQADLRDRIAEALLRWAERGNDPQYASMRRPETVRANAYSRADAVLAVLPEPADRAAVCICGHTEAQHFEDACVTEVTGCDCGDFLTGAAAREVIARWRDAAIQARADRAAILREAADDLATAFGDPMAKHIGALGAAHLRRRARETEAGQAGEEQPETPLEKRLRYSERRNDELRAECKRRGKRVLEQSEKIRALEREVDEVRRQLGAEILRAGQAEAELRRLAAVSGPVAGEQQNETPEAETPTTTTPAASPSVVDEVVAALQAKAQALSVEAEEEMRRDLEDQAQVWHEAADLARRTGRKAVRNAQPTAKPETDGEGAATRFNWSDIIPAPVDETAQERDRLIDCVNRVRVALNDCKERAATGMQYEIAVREAIGDREPRRGPGPLCHESDPRTLRECALKANHGGDHEDGDLAWPRQEHQPAAPADCNTGPAAGVRQDGATS